MPLKKSWGRINTLLIERAKFNKTGQREKEGQRSAVIAIKSFSPFY